LDLGPIWAWNNALSSELPKLAIIAEFELTVCLVVICSLMCFCTSAAIDSISWMVNVTGESSACLANFFIVFSSLIGVVYLN